MLSINDLIANFGDPQAEAKKCRQDCALFDFSFVYRLRVSGCKAVECIEAFQPRTINDMQVGQIRYSVKCDKNGKVRSDLTIWRFGLDTFEVMSGHADDVVELQNLASDQFLIENLSDSHAIFAAQGPNTLQRLEGFVDMQLLGALAYFHFVETEVCGVPCLVGRLGYSGEAGFEFLFDVSEKDFLWQRLSPEISPAGFAAIDILRIEAGLLLFTHECKIKPSISELGLPALTDVQDIDPQMRLMAFAAGLVEGYVIEDWQPNINQYSNPAKGEICITSACYSPCFNSIIGLGFVSIQTKSARVIDPENIFYDIKTSLRPLFDPHKTRARLPWDGYTR